MSDQARLLRNVNLLAGVPDVVLDHLAPQIKEVVVRAGEWLFHEGDPAQSMFIVRSGRVDVIDRGPPETVIRQLRRGESVGELALLRSGTRSASARARRDTELLELGRREFENLIEEAPPFALALTRSLGAQLAATRTPLTRPSPPSTLAVVGLDRAAPTKDVAARLAGALQAFGSVAQLTAGDLDTLEQAERDADRVVLTGATAPGDGWTDLCVREGDVVIALTTGSPDTAWLERSMELRRCELLVFGRSIATSVVESLQPREVQVVADPSRQTDAVEATARRLAGRAVGVVLSGGGARALAHIGVVEELLAAGIRIDRVAGVSLGALVAATTAAGYTSEEMYEAFERNFVATNPSNDFVPPVYSLLRGAKTRRLLEAGFGDRRIEELARRFFCLSCDLNARQAVVHRFGRLADAVYPSLAIPGVFPPVVTPDGRLLVDGGVLDNLPVATMAQAGEGPVIAVDVTGPVGPVRRSRTASTTRIEGQIRRALTGSGAAVPRLSETIVRTVTVGSADTVAAARQHADLVITPQADGVGLMEWKALSRVHGIGRDAARQALASRPDLPARFGF